MNKMIIFLAVFLFFPVFLHTQEDEITYYFPPETPVRIIGDEELPRRFRELYLGMELDDLTENLRRDGLFNFRGERDVSFLPIRDQSLVETSGTSFIRRAFFQLRDGSVFIMSFTLNTNIIDHFSVFTRFVERYGEPVWLDPSIAVWENEETRVSIERPLTVRYIDRIVFDDIINESGLIESNQHRLRQEFLNEF